MNPDQLALWRRIQAHRLDDPQSVLPFSVRLADENNWLPNYTQRAIEEYRRFTFLAAAAGHPVAPSDPVDQVWHLHLLYTRDYWGEFCPRVLGTSLHHGPTRGGVQESDKFTDWYQHTRRSYRRFFGEPAAEFWPETPAHPRYIRIEEGRNWIVPKLTVFGFIVRAVARIRAAASAFRRSVSPAAAAIKAVLVALAAIVLTPTPAAAAGIGDVWPFNLRGPDFLSLFPVIALLIFGIALWARWWMRVPAGPAEELELEPYEIAYLSGGPRRAFVAALAALTKRELVEISGGTVRRTAVPLPERIPLVERAVCGATRIDGTKLRDMRGHVEPTLRMSYGTLIEKGLVMDDAGATTARFRPFLIAAVVPVMGFIKIGVGLDRGRPIEILTMLSVVAAAIALIYLVRPRLSRRGAATLEQLRERNRRFAQLKPAMLVGTDGFVLVPMAVGLWGLGSLAGTELAPMKRELERELNQGGGTGSSCGADGGGSSCGGGGCGGCGGGD